ncbi:Membrane-fusion protein (fragment) [Candidatus Terasakiella magnetica]
MRLKTGHAFKVAINEADNAYLVKLTRVEARIAPVSQTVKVPGAIGVQFAELSAGMSAKVLLASPP